MKSSELIAILTILRVMKFPPLNASFTRWKHFWRNSGAYANYIVYLSVTNV